MTAISNRIVPNINKALTEMKPTMAAIIIKIAVALGFAITIMLATRPITDEMIAIPDKS